MADIVIRSTVVELGLFRDDYDAFVAALAAEGYAARVDEEREEYRSIPSEAAEIGIWVSDHLFEISAGAAIIDAIIRAASGTISKRKKARRTQSVRRIPIHGSGGRIHGYVELPAEDDAPGGSGTG